MNPWELAGECSPLLIEAKGAIMTTLAMERVTYVTKSFLIALALVKRHLTVEDAAAAAQVEVSSQIQRWGEVEDCEFMITIPIFFSGSVPPAIGSPLCAPLLIIDSITAHDVDFHDTRRQLGSAACLLADMV